MLKLPVIISTGKEFKKESDKTIIITANIHGNEYLGISVIHRLIEQLQLNKLKGKIIYFPTLNPAGIFFSFSC